MLSLQLSSPSSGHSASAHWGSKGGAASTGAGAGAGADLGAL